MSRVRWRDKPEERRKVIDFYGGHDPPRCVVTNAEGAHIHHLDGDSSNTVFRNGVQIRGDFNGLIEIPKLHDLGIYESNSLYRMAENFFLNNEYARAYGISRLVAFLALGTAGQPSDHWRPSDVCRFSALALEACRVLAQPGLGVDVIRRNLVAVTRMPTKWVKVSLPTMSVACRAVGSWFSSLEDFFSAAQWYRRALILLRPVRVTDPETALGESIYTKRKLLHAWRMATGRDHPRLRERLAEEYQALNRIDFIDSNAGDLVIASRAVIRHGIRKNVDSLRDEIDRLAVREFKKPFDPMWLLDATRRPRELNPWNWTGIIDVQADFALLYDGKHDDAMHAVEQLVRFHHGRAGRVFRSNASTAWRKLATAAKPGSKTREPESIVPAAEQMKALADSQRLAAAFAVSVEDRIRQIPQHFFGTTS